ncbi:MAG: hypothetical protein [Bacteriophage sp.]|nr:MAG: hypothetical protein [Bacteriophage sp.]
MFKSQKIGIYNVTIENKGYRVKLNGKTVAIAKGFDSDNAAHEAVTDAISENLFSSNDATVEMNCKAFDYGYCFGFYIEPRYVTSRGAKKAGYRIYTYNRKTVATGAGFANAETASKAAKYAIDNDLLPRCIPVLNRSGRAILRGFIAENYKNYKRGDSDVVDMFAMKVSDEKETNAGLGEVTTLELSPFDTMSRNPESCHFVESEFSTVIK